MIITLLTTLASAGTSASAGCFNGGLLVGMQGGFARIALKDKLDSKKAEDIAKLIMHMKLENSDERAKLAAESIVSGKISTADLSKAFISKLEAEKGSPLSDQEKSQATIIATLVSADELKLTSNNGFGGVHLGYLGRVNDNFLVGGLIEGNWVFGQDLKFENTTQNDLRARFNMGVYLRAMFKLTERFMAGVDFGIASQEIRLPNEVTINNVTTTKKLDKKSNWYWGPAARLVLGFSITDHVLATAFFGGMFSVKRDISYDGFNNASGVKTKCSNWNGGVGISYAFGG